MAAATYHLGASRPPPWWHEWSFHDHRIVTREVEGVACAGIVCRPNLHVSLSRAYSSFRCNIVDCEFVAGAAGELEAHQQRAHNKAKFRCISCGKEYCSSSALRQHSRDRGHTIPWNMSALYAEMIPVFAWTPDTETEAAEEQTRIQLRQLAEDGELSIRRLTNPYRVPTYRSYRFLQELCELQNESIRQCRHEIRELESMIRADGFSPRDLSSRPHAAPVRVASQSDVSFASAEDTDARQEPSSSSRRRTG